MPDDDATGATLRDRRLDELLDRTAIVDVTHRMARCFDQLDWVGLEGCFCDEIAVRYEHVVGDDLVTASAAAFVEAWRGAMSGLEATQHLLTTHRVDVAGDEATCTAYCLVQHYYPDPSGSCVWTLGGHYDFGFVRTDDGWLIDTLELTGVWAHGNRFLLARAAAHSPDVPPRGGDANAPSVRRDGHGSG